jgi:fumarylacetoacetate (FAA) hydrolase
VKLCTFVPRHGSPPDAHPGLVHVDRVTRLAAAGVVEFLAGGMIADHAESYALADVILLAPVPTPPSIRDFFSFERHVATARARRGLSVPEYWYTAPVFYFTNPAAVVGPGAPIPYPSGTAMLDYELEVAAIIGRDERIAGFTIMNDWSARDIQRAETTVGLGPAKGKDFATSLGPFLVTVDEFDGARATMVARVNGVERSRGDLAELHFGWEAMRERAGLNTRLRPGDVLGSGTVGTGCILEHEEQVYLTPGDSVELEVAGLGVLRNTVSVSTIDSAKQEWP